MRVALRRSRRVSVTEAIVASMRAHLPSVSVMNIGRLRSSMAIDSLPAFKAPSPSVCAAVRARERESAFVQIVRARRMPRGLGCRMVLLARGDGRRGLKRRGELRVPLHAMSARRRLGVCSRVLQRLLIAV